MPIYEYQCRQCGHRFSHLHRRLNEAAPACPKCGSEVKKLFSSFSATSEASAGCPHADSCPAAGHTHGPGCGCGCGCHH